MYQTVLCRLAIVVLFVSTCAGCSVERWRAYHQCKANQAEAKAEALRYETEVACCENRSEAEALRGQYNESIKSKLGLNLDQQMMLGQIQVDEEKMLKLLEARKKRKETIEAIQSDFNKKRSEMEVEALKKQVAEALKSGNPEAIEKAIADCCRPKPTCVGGAEPITRPSVPEPLEAPLLPTEIPFLIPVTLKVQMDTPTIEATRVNKQIRPEALKEQCCPEPCCAPCTESCTPGCIPLPSQTSGDNSGYELHQAPPFIGQKTNPLVELLSTSL